MENNILLHTKNILKIKELEKTSLLVFLLLGREMNTQNKITISKTKKVILSQELCISERTFEGCLLKLSKNNMISRVCNGEYMINREILSKQ